ncbi:hypothetical protein E2C01_007186 [Portunus trituberculatus]|uniref:Uncharacterized protein n=1 Tax=Portunus trituberculatus TaxID=210409 RepID=A0A5B7CZT7_PORTR|nr:hypothetical protein [Portunus trituberculatus]
MSQPVPTASFRSYRRVGENSSRSTSVGDLRKVSRSDTSTDLQNKTEEGSSRQVTRKNSLRDRFRQLHTPFTSERRKQAAGRGTHDTHKNRKKSAGEQQQGDQITNRREGGQQQHQSEEKTLPTSSATTNTTATTTITSTSVTNITMPIVTISNPVPTLTPTTTSIITTTTATNTTPGMPQVSALQISVSPQHQTTTELQVGSNESSAGVHRQRPRYMLPTRASSHYSPGRPSSIDLDSRSGSSSSKASMGRWSGTPPSSGRCSPSKFEVSGRRGSIGGESPVRSGSPRRGSLDCLAWPHPRALSPPTSPIHTPTRSSHGSTSSLLASEEYREGSPEKLWISSLRTDTSKTKGVTVRCVSARKDGRSRSGSGDNSASDRLKRTALTTSEETDPVRTPLKPAMGVSMIGKQRRTPGVLSPRDVFFSSPPSSPTLSSVSSSISPHHSSKNSVPPKLRNQKILPHYPGMEYPPVFEPGSYSLCPADQTVSSADQGLEGGIEGRTSVESRVVYTMAQVKPNLSKVSKNY